MIKAAKKSEESFNSSTDHTGKKKLVNFESESWWKIMKFIDCQLSSAEKNVKFVNRLREKNRKIHEVGGKIVKLNRSQNSTDKNTLNKLI